MGAKHFEFAVLIRAASSHMGAGFQRRRENAGWRDHLKKTRPEATAHRPYFVNADMQVVADPAQFRPARDMMILRRMGNLSGRHSAE
jgi:hypothetical protein